MNDNAYIIDFSSEYNVHNVSNVNDLSPYIVCEPLDLRMNPFYEGECDTIIGCIDYPPRPFTHRQEKELQYLQAMFVRKEALGEFERCQRKRYNE